MRAVHALLADELPWQTLLQGDAPKAQLLRRFRERPSVLFASQSFWEGVDVPGEALSLVVIDKLPFASPGEPIVAARIDRLRADGQDAFYGYQVPQAALALKQGFGRLIRSATDRGIVAVLDGRMTRKGYGRLFLQTLPRCGILRSPAEAVDCGIGYVPRERRVEGLVLFLPVAANVTLADLESLSRYGLIDAREERRARRRDRGRGHRMTCRLRRHGTSASTFSVNTASTSSEGRVTPSRMRPCGVPLASWNSRSVLLLKIRTLPTGGGGSAGEGAGNGCGSGTSS